MFTVAALAAMAIANAMSSTQAANAQAENAAATINYENSQKENALKALDGYGYQMYQSPNQSYYDQFIKDYLGGKLSEGQEAGLQQADKMGMSNINTTMANRGGTVGGQLAMSQKHNQDLTNQRMTMVDQNIGTGLGLAQYQDQFNAQQWLTNQQAEMRKKELDAQYAPGDYVEAKKSTIWNSLGF
jgi:hypothetical protein